MLPRFVTSSGAPIDWSTAVVGDIAVVDIFKVVDNENTSNDSRRRWATAGQTVPAWKVRAAQVEAAPAVEQPRTATTGDLEGLRADIEALKAGGGTVGGGGASSADVVVLRAAVATATARANALRDPVGGAAVSSRAPGRSINTTSAVLVQTTRVRHVITEPTIGAHLFFVGWGNGEGNQGADATIKAGIEVASGAVHPVTFNGVRTATLLAGQTLRSDSTGLILSKGDVVWVRVARTIASGAWTANCQLLGATYGEGSVDSDAVDSASTAFTVPANDTTTGWTAHALVSAGTSAARSVAFIGDSLSNGQNESARELGGYMLRCLPDNVGVIRANAGGGTAKEFVNNSTSGSSGRRRLGVAASAKYAWVEYGINDVNGGDSAETVCASLLKLWTALAGAGLIVCQSTITLWANGSTDGYQTVENQGVWAKNDVRTAVNDYIRSKPAPLSHVFEMADVVESSRNSGKWKAAVGGVALCSDGIHPSTLGHQLIADALRAQAATVFV